MHEPDVSYSRHVIEEDVLRVYLLKFTATSVQFHLLSHRYIIQGLLVYFTVEEPVCYPS